MTKNVLPVITTAKRPAFLKAFAGAHKFNPVPPKSAALASKFTG